MLLCHSFLPSDSLHACAQHYLHRGPGVGSFPRGTSHTTRTLSPTKVSALFMTEHKNICRHMISGTDVRIHMKRRGQPHFWLPSATWTTYAFPRNASIIIATRNIIKNPSNTIPTSSTKITCNISMYPRNACPMMSST